MRPIPLAFALEVLMRASQDRANIMEADIMAPTCVTQMAIKCTSCIVAMCSCPCRQRSNGGCLRHTDHGLFFACGQGYNVLGKYLYINASIMLRQD